MQSDTGKDIQPKPQKIARYIDLPKEIKDKKIVMNVQNKDKRSFEYAILSALYHRELKVAHEWPSQYKKYLGKLDFTGIEFPVSWDDINKFEKQNPGIGVNIYNYEEEIVGILRTNLIDPQNAIDLLYITNEENQHYCWIKNFPKLVASQASKSGRRYYFCRACYKKYLSTKRLDYHLLKCKTLRNLFIRQSKK